MDIDTINKMLLLNKYFYEIYSNDIVWNHIFHKRFTKYRIITKDDLAGKSLTEKNELGKKRKRFISAMKTAKDMKLEAFRPAAEDCYDVVVTGFLEYMPIENVIKDTYGPSQDIFSFFNCNFFYEETVSLLTFYHSPYLNDSYRKINTDCFVLAFNRYFPDTIKHLEQVKKLLDLKYENILVLENSHVPADLEIMQERLTEEEFEELKHNIDNVDQNVNDSIDSFIQSIPEENFMKVDICSNENINEVFLRIISFSRGRKDRRKGNKGELLSEADLQGKVKNHKTKQPYILGPDDINQKTIKETDTRDDGKAEKKKCMIF